ncbi:MarR family winged helix-turn-helix transcriptional regulator [Pyruvatibacter sp. HU-CL02332]|uniref:MarR family winged helix-turn-helix transcriptional regulator n=1 Tax=Pyruvatibacter sp. HU-CL02332 TaxID=3127650 RepID=UPI00296A0AF5|nr:MarR family transcriptional regulator [Alphaproteobacteria bacterium]
MDIDKSNQPSKLNDPTLFTFFNEIGIIDQLARTAFERVLPKGLTVPQFSVLNHFVRLGGPRTPAQLASSFQVSRATMTNTLKRLDEAGFIVAERDPDDGRSKKIDITQSGRDIREVAVGSLMPLLAELSTRLDLSAIATLIPTLQAARIELDNSRELAGEVAAKQKDQ